MLNQILNFARDEKRDTNGSPDYKYQYFNNKVRKERRK